MFVIIGFIFLKVSFPAYYFRSKLHRLYISICALKPLKMLFMVAIHLIFKKYIYQNWVRKQKL